jgi:serine/threonine protein kinase
MRPQAGALMAVTTTTTCPICGAGNLPTAAACSTCGASLGSDPSSAFSGALPPGTKLQGGMYSVGKVLGQGGFGITYLGGDIRSRRPVAIKELFPYGSTRRGTNVHPFGGLPAAEYASTRARFLDEARILARFDHPGIVDVYGTFEENNTAYMVMELLRGKTLGQMIEERGPLPEAEAIGYIRRVGEALIVVHEASLLHRDLKPDNIMLTGDGEVVLIDFGTARAFAAGKTGRMTTMVTPGYAPLEQYGQSVRFGPFTDVYALAATLYHVLTGQMPASATDRASGVELMPPRTLNPEVSKVTSDAILWAMSMRVDQRPQNVREFLDGLPSAEAERSIWSPPVTVPSRSTPTVEADTTPAPPAPTPPPAPVPAPPRMPRPTWRPPVPYEGPYDVEATGSTLHWPQNCACCFEPSDAAFRIEHTTGGGFLGLFQETSGWDVPYCSRCIEHIQLDSKRPGGNLGGAVAGMVIGGPVGLLVGLGSAAYSIYGATKHQSQLESLLKPTCVAVGPAAAYRGWYEDTHTFTFLNWSYADAFMRANGGALVS